MVKTGRIITVVILFLLASLVIHQKDGTVLLNTKPPQLNAPLKVKNWKDIAVDYDPRTLSGLDTDEMVFRRYHRNPGEEVTVYMGYYRSLAKAKMSHAPQVCFIGQGWTIVDKRTEEIKLDGKSLQVNANRLLVENGAETELALYWYQTPQESYTSLPAQKLSLLIAKIKGDRDDNAFVRVSTSVEDEDVDRAFRVTTEFLGDFYPALLGYFSRIGND